MSYIDPYANIPHHRYPGRNPKFPALITWVDPTGKLHIPPDPPLVEGYPSWSWRPNEYKRNQELKRCPAKACRRARSCVAPHYGKFCQKTHTDAETYRKGLLNRVLKIMRSLGHKPPPPLPTGEIGPPPPKSMKRALEKAWVRNWNAALLEFQTNWINEQKRKFEAPKAAQKKPSQKTKAKNH
jgi:hypothetical protein